MIVLSLSDCPPRLRGDLSRWLCELSTGVYVGQLSTRVRDELWQRVCDNLKSGRATMVYSTNGEQRMDFRVHNAAWEPIDFDGIKLMLRPSVERMQQRIASKPMRNFSNAAGVKKARAYASTHSSAKPDYVIIDIETTGLSCMEDEIIELSALRVSNEKVIADFSMLARPQKRLSNQIVQLTGITEEMLCLDGKPLKEALQAFLTFIGEERVIAHNAAFDESFLRSACQVRDLPLFHNPCIDTLTLARRKLPNASSYKLIALADSMGFDVSGAHRGLKDCQLTFEIYKKLLASEKGVSEKSE